MVMKQLGYKQSAPTSLYINNYPAMRMTIDNMSPIESYRHVDILYWALQDWVQEYKSFIMQHCAGVLNVSDDLTKPLGYVLHVRHCRRLMGNYT